MKGGGEEPGAAEERCFRRLGVAGRSVANFLFRDGGACHVIRVHINASPETRGWLHCFARDYILRERS